MALELVQNADDARAESILFDIGDIEIPCYVLEGETRRFGTERNGVRTRNVASREPA